MYMYIYIYIYIYLLRRYKDNPMRLSFSTPQSLCSDVLAMDGQ